MNNKNYLSIRLVTALALCLSTALTPILQAQEALEKAQAKPQPSIYSDIATELMGTEEFKQTDLLQQEATKQEAERMKTLGFFSKIYDAVKKVGNPIPNPALKNTTIVMHKLPTVPLVQQKSLINRDAWLDLEFFKQGNLIKTIPTHTIFGKAGLTRLLAQPPVDKKTILERQALLKRMIEDEALYTKLVTALNHIKEAEDFFAQYWVNLDMVFGDAPTEKRWYDVISHNTVVNEIAMKFNQSVLFLMYSVPVHIQHFPQAHYALRNGNYRQGIGILAYCELFTAFAVLIELFIGNAVKGAHAYNIKTALCVNSLVNIYQELATQQLTNFPSFAALESFVQTQESSKKKFMNLMNTGTLKGTPAYFFARHGRCTVAEKLFNQVKQDLCNALEAIGIIDAFVAMATMYKESQRQNSAWSLVNFVDQATPYIKLNSFRNPLLKSGSAITNDIELGNRDGNSIVNSRNMMLTGQNTAGKTTVIKAIALSVLFAQTFGIAPAAQATMTPFANLITHVNVMDDVQHNLSLFASEVNRTNSMLNNVKALKPGEFSLVIIDEIFRSTGPDHAAVLADKLSRKLAKFPNCIAIQSTHYPQLVKLEQETNGVYKNYKMEIHKQDNGTLIRPYKLEPGFTLTNIANDILQEQGVSLEDDAVDATLVPTN